MRPTSIYPGGPERSSGDPLTDAAEVRAARLTLSHDGAGNYTFRGPVELVENFRASLPTWEELEERVIIAGVNIIDPATSRRVTPEEFLAGVLGPEQFDSHEEYEAARDRESWGDDPFGED